MPPKRTSIPLNNNNNNNSKKGKAAAPPKRVDTESLLATEAERHATSKSMYGDACARVSSNVASLHDRARHQAYRAALRSAKGKRVLHLGCGAGLYSLLAAKEGGAALVVALDTSAVLDASRVVAEQNGLQDRVVFLRGRLRDVLGQLPTAASEAARAKQQQNSNNNNNNNSQNEESPAPATATAEEEKDAPLKYDIVLCEWMGTFLLNDYLLDDVRYARDHLLAPGGVVCPDTSSIHVCGVSDYDFWLDTEDYWSNVYGYRMSAMKELVRREVEMCSIPAKNIVTNTCRARTVTLFDTEGHNSNNNNNNKNKAATAASAAGGGGSNGKAAKADQSNNEEEADNEKKNNSGGGSLVLPPMTGDELAAYRAAAATAADYRAKKLDNPIEAEWEPSAAAQDGLHADFCITATRDATIHYLTFYVDASFASPVDPGANFVLGIQPGGGAAGNAWTEVSVNVRPPLPVAAGETVKGAVHAFMPAARGGKATCVRVTARTEGRVVDAACEGEYYWQC